VLVLIDTNALHNDYRFTNTSLQAILKERRLGYRVAISEVTLYEHARHYLKEYKEATRKLMLLDGTLHGVPALEDAAVRDVIRQRAKEAGIEILAFPSVGHDALVDRAVQGHRPFTDDGKQGYRDALIWETVKEYAQKEDVVLIANDNDFGKGELNSVLQDEAAELPFEVKRYRTYKHFVDKVVIPKQQELADIEKALSEGKREVGASKELKGLIERELPGFEASPEDLALERYSHVTLVHPNQEPRLVHVEARQLGDGDVLLRMTLHTRVDFVAMRLVQVGEDDFDWDCKDYENIPVDIEVEVLATPELDSILGLTVQRVVRNEDEEQEDFPHEHGKM
jgi:hypothetical protein